MNNLSISPSPLQIIECPLTLEAGIKLYVKRDDLLHPLVSGNKWRKLKYNIEQMCKEGKNQLLTFGGAFSNHIYATAAMGKLLNIGTVGIIRGEEQAKLSPILNFAKDCGMQLVFWDRQKYRLKDEKYILEEIQNQYPKHFVVPEGGANGYALQGCKEIVGEINIDFDYCVSACGTGTTIAGLAQALKAHQRALAIPVLKADGYMQNQIKRYAPHQVHQVQVYEQYHFGKYAAIDLQLVSFMDWFEQQFAIPIDPVYTAKMFYGLFDLIKKGKFKNGDVIIAIHTGGLQGLIGMQDKITRIRQQLTKQK